MNRQLAFCKNFMISTFEVVVVNYGVYEHFML